MSTLIAYFSCTGVTERLAKILAASLSADLYRIEPAVAYTLSDLNWNDSRSRSSVEMADAKARPALGGEPLDLGGYDIIFLGSPLWWGVPPRIINSFLEAHDLRRKTLVPFVTSGSSGVGETDRQLHVSCPSEMQWRPATRFAADTSAQDLLDWANRQIGRDR